MLDFDFNSVKKHNNDNISKISLFDSVCNQLEKFFNIFFTSGSLKTIKFDFEKVNNYIKVSTECKYNIYINYDSDKYQDIIKDVPPYLKYVILDDSIKLTISKDIFSSKVGSIIKKFNFINHIIFLNNIMELSSIDEIEAFNSLLSKNKKLVIKNFGCPVISEKQLKSLKIYSDEIHIEFLYHIFRNFPSSNLTYLRNGLKSFDQSIKNDNCKVILDCDFQEDIIFLKNIISKLNLNHNWIIK